MVETNKNHSDVESGRGQKSSSGDALCHSNCPDSSIQEKLCVACKKWLPLDDFNLQSSKRDGKHSKCKPCQRRYQRDHHKKHPSSQPVPPYDIARAQAKCRAAVRVRTLKKPKRCVLCGREARLDGHHADYNKPLEVLWLCRQCHVRLHGEVKEGKRPPVIRGVRRSFVPRHKQLESKIRKLWDCELCLAQIAEKLGVRSTSVSIMAKQLGLPRKRTVHSPAFKQARQRI